MGKAVWSEAADMCSYTNLFLYLHNKEYFFYMGSRFAGKVVSKEGKPCVYFMVIYWSILSINRHGNSLLELCFLGVFNFINWIFGWVFCFAWLGFFLIAERSFSAEFLCFPSLQKADGLVYVL